MVRKSPLSFHVFSTIGNSSFYIFIINSAMLLLAMATKRVYVVVKGAPLWFEIYQDDYGQVGVALLLQLKTSFRAKVTCDFINSAGLTGAPIFHRRLVCGKCLTQVTDSSHDLDQYDPSVLW